MWWMLDKTLAILSLSHPCLNNISHSFHHTQVKTQCKSSSLELQGDVVSSLALSMEQYTVGLPAPESHRDHVLHCAGRFLIKPVQQSTVPIKVCHVWLWEAHEHIRKVKSGWNKLTVKLFQSQCASHHAEKLIISVDFTVVQVQNTF